MEYRDSTPISPNEIDYDENKVDPRVANYTRQVREKMHGIDTREAMARAEEISSVVSTEAKEISEETKGRQTILEQQFDDQISNMTLQDPSSAEMVAAQTNRITGENWQTIGNRLDDENERVTAQLAQKASKTEANNIQTQVDNLVLGAVGDGNNAEVIQARSDSNGLSYPTIKGHLDSIERVIKEGKATVKFNDWFRGVYDGATGGVTPYHLGYELATQLHSFTGDVKKIDVSITNGYKVYVAAYNTLEGNRVKTYGWYTTDFSLDVSIYPYYRFLISYVESKAATLDMPDYVDFSFEYPSQLKVYTDTKINNINATFSNLITTGENIFNVDTLGQLGTWCNYTNGRLESTQYVTTYKCSDYIKVKPSTAYSRLSNKGQFGTVFFDENKNYIDGVTTDKFTTPSNCVYAILNESSHVGFTDVLVEGNLTISSAKSYPYYNKFVYSNNEDTITIGIGTKYPTIKEGFEYARANDKSVIINPGTYNLVEEGISGIGYILPKKVYGYGVTLLCNLPTENWSLSPLNVGYTTKGAEVYGLTVICSNCRYNIHDDMGAMTRGGYYKNVFKDLTLIHNSAPSSVLINPNNIGGGFGDQGEIWIENCIMESQSDINSDYHSSFAEVQTNGCKAFFKDCVMNKTVTGASVGSSTDYMNAVYVTNCLVGTLPQSRIGVNNKLVAWNNVLNA
ncbi:hypothetical protein ACTQ5K_02715 [Niallia sp. Sow4_A1]|uniref:hypothetical protein n=1 Tax=Niallia sp. Sow4_A1 TaxID=3438793 RepID=UPI003F945ACA